MVGVGHHVLYFIAMPPQSWYVLGLFAVDHCHSVVEKGRDPGTHHLEVTYVPRWKRQEVVLDVFLAYLADAAEIVEY